MGQVTFFKRLDDCYENLTKKQIKLADYIRSNYKTAVFLACVPLAREVGVSEATVVRFANALGYEGFTEMINHIREYMKNEITTLDKVKGLESAYKNSDVVVEITENNVKIIRSLQKLVTREKLDAVVENMVRCRKMVICGFEGSSGLAEYMGYHMVRAGRQVEIVNEKFGNLFSIVNSVDQDTFVISVGFPRYVKDQLKLSKILSDKGANILAITDSPKSPLMEHSDYSFIIPIDSRHGSNIDVYVAVMSLFQILVFEFGLKDYDNIKRNLNLLEGFNTYFDIFHKGRL